MPNRQADFKTSMAAGAAVCLVLLFLGLDASSSAAAEDQKSGAVESLERRQKAEIMGYYLGRTDQGTVPKTDISIQAYNRAVEHFRRQEFDLARQLLEEAVAYDEKNSLAFELLGDIDYLEQKMTGAVDRYKSAYRLLPRPGLREKLEKTLKEQELEKGFLTYEDSLFIIRYQSRDAFDGEGERLAGILRKSYGTLSKNYGFYFKQPVVVLVYNKQDFRQVTGLPHWIAGLYDGKIRLPGPIKAFSESEFYAMAVHEMMHAVITGISRGRAPSWIHEGLSVYEDNKVHPRDFIIFRAAVKTRALIPLDQLMNQKKTGSEEDPLLTGLFYEESYSLVAYLAEKYGMIKIRQILDEFAKGRNSDDALSTLLGISVAQLEMEWKDSIVEL